MNRTEKNGSIEELTRMYSHNSAVIITHYHGLSVGKIHLLRKRLKEQGGELRVVKNTLARIAAKNSGLNNVEYLLNGPVAIAYSSDPVSVAKILHKFAKENESLKIIGGILDSNAVSREIIEKLSTMPSLTEIRGKIVGVISAPATQIACILTAPASQVARVLSAYSNK